MITDETFGANGFFMLPRSHNPRGLYYLCIVSDGELTGWEHVSVTIPSENRCCTWEEMCYLKEMFWSDDAYVIQFHPAKKDYVNNHFYCLHLWRPVNEKLPIPDKSMVGI